MSDDAEQQADEIEVLKSIYEGDDNFKQVDATTYQYKVFFVFYIPSLYISANSYNKAQYWVT